MTGITTKARWIFLGAFVFLQVCLGAGALMVLERKDLLPQYQLAWYLVVFPFTYSHAALIGWWVAFGGRLRPWRLLVMVCLLAAVARLAVRFTPEAFRYLSLAYVLEPLLVSLLFLAMRLVGWRVECCRTDATKTKPQQHSLAELFAWITVIAVVIGILRWTPETSRSLADLYRVCRHDPLLPVEIALITIPAPAAAWVALGSQRRSLRLGMFVTTIMVCPIVYALFRPDWWTRGDGPAMLALFVADPLLLALWLSGLRVLGYRVTWNARFCFHCLDRSRRDGKS